LLLGLPLPIEIRIVRLLLRAADEACDSECREKRAEAFPI
jgi:hypothetical protein